LSLCGRADELGGTAEAEDGA
jgi:hypothetical protein